MPTQQISPSPARYNVASLAKIGITPDELGRPTPWSNLIRKSPAADLRYASELLADLDEPSTRDFLAGLANGELCFVADFLNSLGVPFFFVAWDHERTDTAERGGPDRQSVLALLDHHHHRPVVDLDNDRLDRIWQAVNMLLDELRKRQTVSFTLVWQSGRTTVPELDYFGHNREIGWRALWQTLPFEDRRHVPGIHHRDPWNWMHRGSILRRPVGRSQTRETAIGSCGLSFRNSISTDSSVGDGTAHSPWP